MDRNNKFFNPEYIVANILRNGKNIEKTEARFDDLCKQIKVSDEAERINVERFGKTFEKEHTPEEAFEILKDYTITHLKNEEARVTIEDKMNDVLFLYGFYLGQRAVYQDLYDIPENSVKQDIY